MPRLGTHFTDVNWDVPRPETHLIDVNWAVPRLGTHLASVNWAVPRLETHLDLFALIDLFMFMFIIPGPLTSHIPHNQENVYNTRTYDKSCLPPTHTQDNVYNTRAYDKSCHVMSSTPRTTSITPSSLTWQWQRKRSLTTRPMTTHEYYTEDNVYNNRAKDNSCLAHPGQCL